MVAALGLGVVLGAGASHAQGFYEGKTVTLIVLTTAWPFVRSWRRRSVPAIEAGRP